MHLTDSVCFDAPEFRDLYLLIAKEKGFLLAVNWKCSHPHEPTSLLQHYNYIFKVIPHQTAILQSIN